ncbi:MAG: hypothetical protein ACI9OJ_002199 [Myxococcota bacterium]|jgi:hypothetical protein
MSKTIYPILLLGLVAAAGCDETTASGGVLTIGFNTAGDPNSFQALEEGGSVPVVVGTQGALMLVGAVESNQFGDIDTIEAVFELKTPDGESMARYKFRRKVVVDSDGYIYLHDVFLVVEESAARTGAFADRDATLHVTLQRVGGGGANHSQVGVRLSLTEQ